MQQIYNLIIGQTNKELKQTSVSDTNFQEVKISLNPIGYINILKRIIVTWGINQNCIFANVSMIQSNASSIHPNCVVKLRISSLIMMCSNQLSSLYLLSVFHLLLDLTHATYTILCTCLSTVHFSISSVCRARYC